MFVGLKKFVRPVYLIGPICNNRQVVGLVKFVSPIYMFTGYMLLLYNLNIEDLSLVQMVHFRKV